MSEVIKPTTEQPWAYVPEGQMIVMGGDITRMIADVRGWGWLQKLPNGAEIQDANGRLIAAAPELLAASRLLIDALEGGRTEPETAIAAARAAIEKALPNTVAEVK